jgi:nucleoid DNA-binding protein
MRKYQGFLLSFLLVIPGAIQGQTPSAPSEGQSRDESFNQRLSRLAKLPQDNAGRFLSALGPAIQEELRRGNQVSLPGLGTFRVVRVAEHRDLQIGRPVTIAAVNTIEFVPAGELTDSANSAGALPAETVPAFQYIPLLGQTPGQRVGRTRVPPVRTR